MARKKTSTCLIGCGVGCLLLIIVAILIAIAGAFFVKDTVSGFDDAVDTRDELEERFGEPEDFVPAPGGSIPPDRMEVFLAVRVATDEQRGRIVDLFESLPMNEEAAKRIEEAPFLEKMQAVLGITGSALGLGAAIGDFFEARNHALLEQGMGLGEYSYIGGSGAT